jgi:hypothetical protein
VVPSPTSSPSPSFCSVGPGCRHRLPSPACSSPSLPRGPASLDTKLLPPHARSLSLSRCAVGPPVSSAFPAPAVDQHACTRARLSGSSATSLAHAPQLLLKHHPRPHSLPRPISHNLALSRALPSSLNLAGNPRPPCRSSSSPEATPSDPELHPKVRHLFPCSISQLCFVAGQFRLSAAPAR